ncbi:CACTA en-spm transposon protein [Cucumis melo var. makuwa]|uniref:CACTA en-spm transposon protein n=1 Tax=Cucumis melo var. makuwa TaxID=1194695 RepID=A0A5A7VD02_CUCMM|nr:CACTA en-spm transposon protein [Cucumis melo var. makuwa]
MISKLILQRIKIKLPRSSITIRKWSIPDAEKHVGIKNVENKGFPDAVNNASGDASGKLSFSTHHEGVDKNTSGKGVFPDAVNSASSGVGNRGFSRRRVKRWEKEPKPRGEKERRRRSRRRPSPSFKFPFVPSPSVVDRPRRCPSPPSATLVMVAFSVLNLLVSRGVIMSYRRSNFMETDDMFLQFEEDLDNIAGGSSSVGDNTGSSSQQTTPTPRRRAQSRLLELKRHVAINGRILMTIAPGAEKPISPHAVRFSQAIGWADVGREYIEVVKGDLQRLFVLDFNDQAMNRFVEHQMFTTFKEFRTDCHRHFKKYSDSEEARANPPNALVGRDEDWHFLYDHYISRAF